MMLAPLFQQPANTNQPHGQLESAMFWVGVLFAFLPLAVIAWVAGWTWWNRRQSGERKAPPSREGRERGA